MDSDSNKAAFLSPSFNPPPPSRINNLQNGELLEIVLSRTENYLQSSSNDSYKKTQPVNKAEEMRIVEEKRVGNSFFSNGDVDIPEELELFGGDIAVSADELRSYSSLNRRHNSNSRRKEDQSEPMNVVMSTMGNESSTVSQLHSLFSGHEKVPHTSGSTGTKRKQVKHMELDSATLPGKAKRGGGGDEALQGSGSPNCYPIFNMPCAGKGSLHSGAQLNNMNSSNNAITNTSRNIGNSSTQPALLSLGTTVSNTVAVTNTHKGNTSNGLSDFQQIGSVARNIGSSASAMELFFDKCCLEHDIAWGLLWQDPQLSSNHVPTTVKYCTPSVPCATWYCSCDRHIRAAQGTKPVVGVVFVLRSETDICYFLPLADELLIACDVSIADRWLLLCRILSVSSIHNKVVYNAQLALLPIMNRCGNERMFQLKVTNLFDPKVAAFVCDTDLCDEQMELLRLLQSAQVTIGDSSTSMSMAGMGMATKAIVSLWLELKEVFGLLDHFQARLTGSGAMAAFRISEMPLVSSLSHMEVKGITVSTSRMNELEHTLQEKAKSLMLQATSSIGNVSTLVNFNMNSPEQVANLLYNVLKIPPPSEIGKSKKHHSTSEEDLQKICHLHPVVPVILQFRSIRKTITSFVEGLKPFISASARAVVMSTPKSCASEQASQPRVHANWNHTSVRTGRLSCSKPNLQQFPKRFCMDDITINPRSFFVASSVCSSSDITGVDVRRRLIVAADYSQIEMRVMAHICGDGAMRQLFSNETGDGDIYKHLASLICSPTVGDLQQVTSEMRNRAKVTCLGVIYGMGPAAAALKLGVTVETVNHITHKFFDKFKLLKHWMNTTKLSTKESGFITTLSGRRRYLPDIHSDNHVKKSLAERQAINSIIQGSASDIIKCAMLEMDQLLFYQRETEGTHTSLPPPQLLMQIHDELVYEICVSVDRPDEDIAQFVNTLKDCMESKVAKKFHFTVPLLVNVSIGEDWGNLASYNCS